MYVTGEISTFESRMHQLPLNTGDLVQFKTEGALYTGVYSLNNTIKWNREYNLKLRQFGRTGVADTAFL